MKFLQVVLFFLSINTLAHADLTKMYANRVLLLQGYERIKPDAFYFGIEACVGSVLNKGSNLLNAETRFGHNFLFDGRNHLTPFVGMGFIENFPRYGHHRFKGGILYGTIGFLHKHPFNRFFDVGLNVKVLVGGALNKKHKNWGSVIVGTYLSLPITLYFGPKRRWDYCLEPFNLYLHGSKNSQYYFGIKQSIGYRF